MLPHLISVKLNPEHFMAGRNALEKWAPSSGHQTRHLDAVPLCWPIYCRLIKAVGEE